MIGCERRKNYLIPCELILRNIVEISIWLQIYSRTQITGELIFNGYSKFQPRNFIKAQQSHA